MGKSSRTRVIPLKGTQLMNVVARPSLRLPPPVSRTLRSIALHLPPLNFITLHYAYFIGVSLLSSLIFWGSSTPPRSVSYTDSLFLTVSAMTLAGLNTINLSQLNTFQQFILFVLIIVGSAIWVSIAVVHIRRKSFERRFKSIVEEGRNKRRSRTASISRRTFPLPKSLTQHRPKVDGIVVRGSVIEPQSEPAEDANGNVHVPSRKVNSAKLVEEDSKGDSYMSSKQTSNEGALASPVEDIPFEEETGGVTETEAAGPYKHFIGSCKPCQDRKVRCDPGEPKCHQCDLGGRDCYLSRAKVLQNGHEVGPEFGHSKSPGDLLTINTGISRRITFASSTSPATHKGHGRIFGMQGVGARQNLLNHPLRTPPAIYPNDLPEIKGEGEDAMLPRRHGVYGFLSNGFISRNSQFSSLTLAERERLGGVEYRAVTILAVIVPLYFILWQLLGCIGLGAYVAMNRSDATAVNAENPWWVGAFNGVSAFNNSGMSLLDANMVAFQNSNYMLITMSLMILAGNTCYPVFLRLIIWVMWKLLPEKSEGWGDWKVTLRFLLDHPRRCYTNLFPARHTWWLLATLVCLNGTDWAAFEVLNIGNPTVTDLPRGVRTLDGLFQAFAVRSGGFYVVPIANLRIGLLILYVLMMYISVYPVVITMRNSNVYEERSLGIYADDPQAKEKKEEEASSDGESFFGRIRRTMTNKPGSTTESRGYFVRQQLRGQLAHDIWWIVLAVLFITITETSQFERDPVDYSVFNVLFEVVSGYGCVGISVGLPNVAYSFSGGWHVFSKLILCAVMIRGRHRGLPVAIDRAVLLPGEHLAAAEEEDAQIRLDRTMTSLSRGAVNV